MPVHELGLLVVKRDAVTFSENRLHLIITKHRGLFGSAIHVLIRETHEINIFFVKSRETRPPVDADCPGDCIVRTLDILYGLLDTFKGIVSVESVAGYDE